METEEIWKPVTEFDGYDVSTLGRVRNRTTDHVRSPKKAGQGYLQVTFRRAETGRKQYDRYIHRLVWEAHVGAIPDGWQVDHLNGDITDNRLANLEAVTRQENMRRAKEMGLLATGARHGWALHPEKVIRGDAHYLRKNPEKIRRGSAGGANKVTEEQVIEIRRRHALGENRKSLADEFGMHYGNIWYIVTRRTWTHVP